MVGPLLRGRSPTRSVAPKPPRGSGVLLSGISGLARGCRTIWRGVIEVYWFRGELGSIGFGGSRRSGRLRRCRGGVVMIYWFRRPRVLLLCRPYAREGQAVVGPLLRGRSPTRSVAPKPPGGSGVLLSGISAARAWVPNNLARRKRKTRRLLTNRPCSSIVKSPIPKNVYASAIGLCKDFIIMQSRKPSNSDF